MNYNEAMTYADLNGHISIVGLIQERMKLPVILIHKSFNLIRLNGLNIKNFLLAYKIPYFHS